MHQNQQDYNRRWKQNSPDVFKELLRKRYNWIQLSKHFWRIGIFDEYSENRGVKVY
jgi:hypothetical protein